MVLRVLRPSERPQMLPPERQHRVELRDRLPRGVNLQPYVTFLFRRQEWAVAGALQQALGPHQ
jgi:hypothetical protein